jgi:hypothetical protein
VVKVSISPAIAQWCSTHCPVLSERVNLVWLNRSGSIKSYFRF